MPHAMPVAFIGHGSPMNAIQDNDWSRQWRALGAALPRPRAILSVSAHWETDGPVVTGSAQPPTIHDFHGFPQPLFDARYPAPGDPALAQRVVELLGRNSGARIDPDRGLDHGVWSVLLPMFPAADIPVVQLGIDTRRDGGWHYTLARRLGPLRDEGVLIVASGNIVHNLHDYDFRATGAPAWAVAFRDRVNAHVREGTHRALMDWPMLEDTHRAIPTPEHYIPLLYALANGRQGEILRVFNDDVQSAIAMTSYVIGPT